MLVCGYIVDSIRVVLRMSIPCIGSVTWPLVRDPSFFVFCLVFFYIFARVCYSLILLHIFTAHGSFRVFRFSGCEVWFTTHYTVRKMTGDSRP